MLTVTEEFFGIDDIAAIRNWLAQPGAGLFQKALRGEIAKLQIEASEKMKLFLAPDKERFKVDVEAKLRLVMELEKVLEHMNRAAGNTFEPFSAKVVSA